MKRVLFKIIISVGLIGGVVLIFLVIGAICEVMYIVINFLTKSPKKGI